MGKLASFCTCPYLECPLHPTNHDKGCAPCIAKNLKQKEMPSCFFEKAGGMEQSKGSTFKDFAELVLKNKFVD